VRKLAGGGGNEVYGIVGLAHGARKWENRARGKAENGNNDFPVQESSSKFGLPCGLIGTDNPDSP
jgi:hypothetical protein